MPRQNRYILFVFFCLISACASVEWPISSPNQHLLSLGVDSTRSVESRIGDVLPDVVLRTARFRGVTLTSYAPSAADRKKFVAALSALTPLQRAVVQDHLRSVSFVDGLGANAQTVRVDCKEPCVAFDLVINRKVLDETVSEFLTRKERTLFASAGSGLSIYIEGGSMDAIVFILLHETTHMVDGVLRLTPQIAPGFPIPDDAQTPLSRGVWETVTKPITPYQSALLDRVRPGGTPIEMSNAQAFYEELRRTPFVSAYASSQAPEDLAELVAWREMTQKLKQPYRIEIRDGARVVTSFEPMKFPLVVDRLPRLAAFDLTIIE